MMCNPVNTKGCKRLGAPHSKHPQAAYQSGFKHGVDDIKNNGCKTCPTYIFQPRPFTSIQKNSFKDICKDFVQRVDENEASFDCVKTLKDPELADWYICGGRPELHGTDFRECPQPTSRANASSVD